MSLQITAETASQAGLTTGAPSGNVGILLSSGFNYQAMRPKKWLVTAVVTSAPTDLFIWGAAAAGVIADSSDDRWGLVNDKYGRIVAGKLGTALAVGTHHFVVEDIGVYTRLYFQRTAGAADVFITPINDSKQGS